MPPDVVFELAEEFERRLEPLGLAIAIPKSECFSRGFAGDLRKHKARSVGTADDGKGVQREKFPLGVAYRDRLGAERIVAWRDLSSRTRWGLVPDFAMRIRLGGDPVKFYLLELKCIHLSAAWYGQDAGCQREEASRVEPKGKISLCDPSASLRQHLAWPSERVGHEF